MKTPKKQHPAEIAAEEQMIEAIRHADHFLASLFVGVGVYEKVQGSTVSDAIKAGAHLVALRKSNSRPIIYAMGKDGRATMITNALIERLKGMSK